MGMDEDLVLQGRIEGALLTLVYCWLLALLVPPIIMIGIHLIGTFTFAYAMRTRGRPSILQCFLWHLSVFDFVFRSARRELMKI